MRSVLKYFINGDGKENNMTKEIFDLCTGNLPSLHDQVIERIDWINNTLIIQYPNLNFSACNRTHNYSHYHSCNIFLHEIDDADVMVYVSSVHNLKLMGRIYYLQDFLHFLRTNNYRIETISFLRGYQKFAIQGALVNSNGQYSEDCWITVSTKQIMYSWE